MIAEHGSKSNCSAILLDDALTDPQTKPRSFCGLSGEERFEKMFCLLRPYARSGVDDGYTYPHPVSQITVGDAKAKSASLGHGLHRVSNQIEEDLLEFDGEPINDTVAEILFVEFDVPEFESSRLQLQNVI